MTLTPVVVLLVAMAFCVSVPPRERASGTGRRQGEANVASHSRVRGGSCVLLSAFTGYLDQPAVSAGSAHEGAEAGTGRRPRAICSVDRHHGRARVASIARGEHRQCQ
jgi:hypothetical protein